MSLTDQQVIENTHFEIDEEEKLIAYTNLPDGERFAQAVSSKEAVQKNMIGWCNTVREHVALKSQQKDEERVAKKQQRQRGDPTMSGPPTTSAPTPDVGSNPKRAVLEWFDRTQNEITTLGEQIIELDRRRNELREERDQIEPLIKAWKGSE